MPGSSEQYRVIKRLIQTEKSSLQTADHNVYTFEVELTAKKPQIAQAVRDIFDVKVSKVRTFRVKGRRNRRNRYGYYNESDWKKALVTLEEGQSIELT